MVLIRGASSPQKDTLTPEAERILKVLLGEMSVKQAAQLTARITGLKKNVLYRRALDMVDKQTNR